jgi:hypothetical protein
MYLDTLETYFDLFSDSVVEPDLLPGETGSDLLFDGPGSDTGGADNAAVIENADVESGSGDGSDALRRALAEVRNLVSLDQR